MRADYLRVRRSPRLQCWPSQYIPHLGHDARRPSQDVSRCKPEKPDSSSQKPILATIVLNQVDAMGLTVVLNPEKTLAVKQIQAAQELTRVVVHAHLHLGTG
jgi:hypothetical protein